MPDVTNIKPNAKTSVVGGGYSTLKTAIENFDVIYLHSDPSFVFDIGAERLLIKKPIKIVGVLDQLGDPKPEIRGTAGWLTFDRIPKNKLLYEVNKFPDYDASDEDQPGSGIFSIIPTLTDDMSKAVSGTVPADQIVELKNLHLSHTPDINPLIASRSFPGSMHGSATIAYFVDNTLPSTLKVIDCDIDTAASGAIGIEGINDATKVNCSGKHDVIIRECCIKGINPSVPFDRALPYADLRFPGNYIGVRLGGILRYPTDPTLPAITEQLPVDMTDSVFEVSGCTLESALYAGVAGAYFTSNSGVCGKNSGTLFMVSQNIIGLSGENLLSNGVIFFDTRTSPRGAITVIDNRIKLSGYFQVLEDMKGQLDKFSDSSSGISVTVNNADPSQAVRTTITGNVIEFAQTRPPKWPSVTNVGKSMVFDGIIYEDGRPGGSENSAAVIQKNIVRSPSVALLKSWLISQESIARLLIAPLRGIWVRKNAHDVAVVANDLTRLTASYAQIFVDTGANNCIFSGNLYGRLAKMRTELCQQEPVAALLCDGKTNRFVEEDFKNSGDIGWLRRSVLGPVKLDVNSEWNVDILDPLETAQRQCLNIGSHNIVVTLPTQN